MIAVALGLISLVVMIATGVVASSGAEDHLTFLGIGVQTTTAQVFVTGAIFGWLFLVAIWLLRLGIHRSGERCAELAARRSRRPSAWLGFGPADPEEDQQWGGWDKAVWDEPGDFGPPRRPDVSGNGGSDQANRAVESAAEQMGWDRFGGVGSTQGASETGMSGPGGNARWRGYSSLGEANRGVASPAEQFTWDEPGVFGPSGSQGVSGTSATGRGIGGAGAAGHGVGGNGGSDRANRLAASGAEQVTWDEPGDFGPLRRHGVSGTGATGHGGRTPGRGNGRPDHTNRAVAGAAEQAGVVGGDHAGGPLAGRLPGVGAAGGAEGGQVGGRGGAVAGEDRGAEGEDGGGDGGQEPGQERGVDRR